MILREQRRAVVTFIDYTAAFDTESQLFLDEALSSAGVSTKVRRIIHCIFQAASGCVRLRKPDGSTGLSDIFDICRGVLQGDIFSAICFIVGLWRIFVLHDTQHAGVRVGRPPYQVDISRLEYADDAGLIDDETEQSSERISAISVGSRNDAAMEISIPKTNAMHIHPKRRVSCTTEDEVKELNLKHKCPDCNRTFTTEKGTSIHRARWCDGGLTVRSRKGSLADKAVQLAKRKKKELELPNVTIEGTPIDNVYSFDYLGSRMQCDGDERADVQHRMDIAQSVFSSYSHLWADHRLPRSMKLRLYQAAVCQSFSHACEAWDVTDDIARTINGFNSRCLHVITRKTYRETATMPDVNILLLIRQRRMRFLGHILRMHPGRLLRRTLVAYCHNGELIPPGSLLEDCPRVSIDELTVLANDRHGWAKRIECLY